MISLRKRGFEFTYIPEDWSDILQAEILSNYEILGVKVIGVPCLDEVIINRLQFYHLAICHYHEAGELIDDEWLITANNWKYLNDSYPLAEYGDHFLYFREDVKRFLDFHNLAYIENWVFSIYTEDYDVKISNQPLQSVW